MRATINPTSTVPSENKTIAQASNLNRLFISGYQPSLSLSCNTAERPSEDELLSACCQVNRSNDPVLLNLRRDHRNLLPVVFWLNREFALLQKSIA